MMFYRIFILGGLFLLSTGLWAQTLVTYQPSTQDFPNPERGFYRYSKTEASNYTLLNQTTLENYRLLHMPPSANYSIYSTLVFRYFVLDDFKTSNISQAFLDNVQADFNTARNAGVKLIPRFTYTNDVNSTGCSNWICTPYADAAKNWVLTHIAQLQPLFEANKDVIATVQMGFIGVWGENYYTDFFGDASQAPDYKLTDQNWADRIEVLNALLDATPTERMVQVRYPQKKQRTIYGINAPTTSNALTSGEAHQGTDKSRIGFHNDCLLASANDYGTYNDYGNSSTFSSSDTTNLKPYLENDSRFVVVGGETCDDGYSPQNDCASSDASAYGDTELERMHYSFLNSQYNNDVNNDWVTDGCFDEIKKRLGYRFELQNATFSNSAQNNQVIDISIDLKNVGYAAPFNARGVELILRHTLTSEIWYSTLAVDPRFWLADNNTYDITVSICIPNDVPLGDYEILLNLPDPTPTLYANPSYSIRLANLLSDNSDVWEPSTGYNKLGHTITIDNTSSNSACNGEIEFHNSSTFLPVELLHLEAYPNNENIIIQWTTVSEQNNKSFHLEKSKNGRDFTEIKIIEGQGYSETIQNYSYTDTDVEWNTHYYYRLIQKDFDGSSTTSKVVGSKISMEHSLSEFENSIKIYPNPSKGKLHLSWDRHLEEIIQIRVLDVLGNEMLIHNPTNSLMDISSLNNGLYFIELKSRNIDYYQRIIKW